MTKASDLEQAIHADMEPRPEPAPMPWQKLTVEQQRAAAQAFGLIARLTERGTVEQDIWDDHLARLHHDHKNHVIMLDGDRGSGKTTLLVNYSNRSRAGMALGDTTQMPWMASPGRLSMFLFFTIRTVRICLTTTLVSLNDCSTART